MPKIATIESADKKQTLQADSVNGDVQLVLHNAGMQLQLQFSNLLRASFTRPWDYQPLDLNEITCEVRGQTLLVTGRGRKLNANAEFEFRENILHCQATWTALQNLHDTGVAFVVELEHAMTTERVTLPMCLYNGNPSLNPETIAPRFPKTPGASFVEEETRFPIPCANLEWKANRKSRYVSLFTMPDPTDAEWSLGFHRPSAKSICVMAASGSVSFNGTKDENYGSKNLAFETESGYRNLKKRTSITKSFALRFDAPELEGWGFRDIVRTGYQLFNPKVTPALALDEVVKLKTAALDERWHESDTAPGFLCVAPDNIYLRPPYYLWGWTGQAFKMALCSAKQGFEAGKPELVERATRCANFFLQGSRTKTKGLHRNHYYLKNNKWFGEEDFKEERFSSRALGETFWNLSKLILLFRKQKAQIPATWVEDLCAAVDFFIDPKHLLKQAVPPMMWFADGSPAGDEITSAGTACACAAIGAYKVTADKKYLHAAEALTAAHWKIGGNRFDTPFSKATLDAGCEDKEAAIPFFIAAADLFEITRDPKYKTWAEVSGEWLLTWIYFWDVPFKKGSILDRHAFRSTGWPTVSIENQHLDVFFPTYEMYAFGKKHGNLLFQHMAQAVFEACSHGISRGNGDWFFDKPGRQGEQFMHTNWGFMPPIGKYPEKFREHFKKYGIAGDKMDASIWNGGYNPWDTSWIIVMLLEAAQNFKFNEKGKRVSRRF